MVARRWSLVAAAAAIVALLLFTAPADAGVQPAGDANCDGVVTSIDAVFVLQFDAALLESTPCHAQADASFDGVVNSLDAAIILQREARLTSSCAPGETGFSASLRAVDPIAVTGEAVWLTFSVSNCNHHETTRRYGSGQIFDVTVRDEGGALVWNWAHDRGFVQAFMERTYGDRQTVTYGIIWDQADNVGSPVPTGTYDIEAVDVGCTVPGMTQCDLSASTEVQILILPVP